MIKAIGLTGGIATGKSTVSAILSDRAAIVDADRLARFDADFENLRWSDVVVSFVRGGAGVPMGYIGSEGVNTNPHPGDLCSGHAVISLLDERLEVTDAMVGKCLKTAAEF